MGLSTSTKLQLVLCHAQDKTFDKIISSNPLDRSAIAGFISNLAPQERLQLLLGGLLLPFDNLIVTNTLITRFVSSALGKICKTQKESLCKLEAHGKLIDDIDYY